MTNVTLTHRNVCKDGFTIVDTADAGNYNQLSPSHPISLDGRQMSVAQQKPITILCVFQYSWISRLPGKRSNMPSRRCAYVNHNLRFFVVALLPRLP